MKSNGPSYDIHGNICQRTVDVAKFGNETFFVAINLKDPSHVILHMIRQLSRLGTLLGRDRIYISIYESGSSKENDAEDALAMLASTLHAADIQHSVIYNGGIKRGKRHRIDHLAELRNAAIRPMFQLPRKFDRIVFINDVLFCAEDVLILAYHRADIACGLDFARPHEFYDTWVARLVSGQPFRNSPPWIWSGNMTHRPQDSFQSYFYKLNSLPVDAVPSRAVSVGCCWNGLAVIRAQPFYEGVRFRRNLPNECGACECSHMCTDFIGRGYDHFIVDSAVQVAYSHAVYANLDKSQVPFIRQSKGPTPSPAVCFGMSSSTAAIPDKTIAITDFQVGFQLAKAICLSNHPFPRNLIIVCPSHKMLSSNQQVWAIQALHPDFSPIIVDEAVIFSLFRHNEGILKHFHQLAKKKDWTTFIRTAGSLLLDLMGGVFVPFDVALNKSLSCTLSNAHPVQVIPLKSTTGNVVAMKRGALKINDIYSLIGSKNATYLAHLARTT